MKPNSFPRKGSMLDKTLRSDRAAQKVVDAIIELSHMMYNRKTARRFLAAVVIKLDNARKDEFKEVANFHARQESH